MVKRCFDLVAAIVALVLSLPLMATIALVVFLEDRRSPFYISMRVGRGGRRFPLVKFRSMVLNADRTGVDSTAAGDPRITRTGRVIRRFKLDELPQLWNVLVGQMSLVGPRPNVPRETALYTDQEKRLLSIRPGITDLASIIFADEGEILEGAVDLNLLYNQIIRPWKSRFGLLYVDHASLVLDLRLILLTLLALLNRRRALAAIIRLLEALGADEVLVRVASREEELQPFPPPGAIEIVRERA